MESSQEILQEERADTKSRLEKITEVGKPIFEQTALVQNRDFTEDDVAKVQEFFNETKPLIHPKVWPSFWEHINLTIKYAKIFAERIKIKDTSINPYELEVLAMIHDIGRLISPHRLYRTNLVGDSLLKRLNIRPDLLKKQVPEAQLFGRENAITNADQLTLVQQVLMLADNLGRTVEDGKLITLEQMEYITGQQLDRYQGEIFTSERFGKRRLEQTSRKVIGLLNQIKENLKKEYGTDVNEVREEVSKDL